MTCQCEALIAVLQRNNFHLVLSGYENVSGYCVDMQVQLSEHHWHRKDWSFAANFYVARDLAGRTEGAKAKWVTGRPPLSLRFIEWTFWHYSWGSLGQAADGGNFMQWRIQKSNLNKHITYLLILPWSVYFVVSEKACIDYLLTASFT